MSNKLFFELLRIRRIEEFISKKYQEQQIRCPVHFSIGQEAIAVGVCNNLREEDIIISTHRAHAHYLAKGGNLNKMIAEIYGKASGCTKGLGGSMHLVDLEKGIIGCTPIVGGSIPIGVGIAFSDKLNNKNNVTTIFFGDGATEEGVWAESLNFASLKDLPILSSHTNNIGKSFASLKDLPILFVCEDNMYSVNSPINVRQAKKRDRIKIVEAHGICAKKGYGNDIEDVFSLTKDAINYIQSEKKPYYLEFQTYRFLEHCGPNYDHIDDLRSKKEVEFWMKKCPLEAYLDRLLKNKMIGQQEIDNFEEIIKKEIKEAFEFAQNSPNPVCEKINI